MNKKLLSLATVFCLGMSFASGCGKEDNEFSKLTIDGKDIIFTIGENTKYSADDFFNDMLNSEAGSEKAYELILKMLVENTIETDKNMEASWELLLDSFEDEVETKSLSDGISEDEAREALLKEDGFESIEEKKKAYLYEVKLSKLQDKYWKERKNYYYEKYLEERMPYYVKHVLVKTGYSSARGPYASVIDSDDANDLYDVYDLLTKGEKFSYIMNHKSEDPGSADGTGYHMDLTTSFVTEFLHGVFAFDSLTKDKTGEVTGMTSEITDFYLNQAQAGEKDYNFNVIYASDIKTLGDKASSSDYNSISTYEKDDEQNEVSVGSLSNSNAYGSTSALYTRSIIFNNTFNNAGISVIAYDLDEEMPSDNFVEMKINGKTQKVLTDEKGNVVFVAAAKGSGSDLWIHFLTVNVSPFDDMNKLFYSIDEEKTIADMLEAKKTALKAADANITDTDLNTALDAYEKELRDFETYVDIKGGETQKGRNEIIEELEGYVRKYAQRGITSDAVPGEEQFLTYDMVDYYMTNGAITISNEQIKNLVTAHIANRKALIDTKVDQTISKGWDEYFARVQISNSDEINNKKIPMECAYGVNNGATCKFNYDEENGFEIMITYKNVGDSNAYLPTNKETYTSSYRIDANTVITLPTETDSTTAENGMHRDGYKFAGWYSTSTFDEGTEVTSIDGTRTSTGNKVVLYAKWVERSAQ